MFRVQSTETGKFYRLAVIGLLLLSAAALAVTIWVMVDFLKEQAIVEELISKLPTDATESAEVLAGDLRWQFRLTILVVLNLVVTGFAVVLLWRAYRASQESLRDIKALAGDILSSIDQAVITTDVGGNVTSINQRGMEMLSTDVACVGQPLEAMSRVARLEQFRLAWRDADSPTMTRDFLVGENGAQQTLRAFCHTLSDYEGNEIGNVLQIRDVTQTTLIEDRMRRMERYMGLGSLAAGLHHEIKNPLAALSLHVQLLEEQIEEDKVTDEVRQMLQVIKTEVTRVGGVLEGFRDFASIDQLHLRGVDLNELLDRQVELVAPRAERDGIRLRIDKASGLPEVLADRVRLEQVLVNLLVNAIESMPEGGDLTVSTTSTAETLTIGISDTGCGVPIDLRDKILDPYFTTKGDGTGLGLALCDKIMRQHEGSLEFRSTEAGTLFEVKLPVHRKPATTETE